MFLKVRQIENKILKCFWSLGKFLQLTDKQGECFCKCELFKVNKNSEETLIKNHPNNSIWSLNFQSLTQRLLLVFVSQSETFVWAEEQLVLFFLRLTSCFSGWHRRFGVKALRVINEARVGSGLSSPCSWASQFIIVSSFSRRICFCIRTMENTTKFFQDEPQKSFHSEKININVQK